MCPYLNSESIFCFQRESFWKLYRFTKLHPKVLASVRVADARRWVTYGSKNDRATKLVRNLLVWHQQLGRIADPESMLFMSNAEILSLGDDWVNEHAARGAPSRASALIYQNGDRVTRLAFWWTTTPCTTGEE